MARTLRFLLGDQLNAQHTWFEQTEEDILYCMMEMRQETDYVMHHIQKVVAFFSAMRAFAEERQAEGHRFVYLRLDDPENQQQLEENLLWLIERHEITHFAYQLPDEYRLDRQLQGICQRLKISSESVDTEHFLTSRTEMAELFRGKKTYLMETFYRRMRKKFDIMLEADGSPAGGQWNYDAENRNRYDGKVPIPKPELIRKDVSALVEMLDRCGAKTFGRIDAQAFSWPVTRQEALMVLDEFLEKRLPWFGQYQDAMSREHWALFHARISFPMNAKILSPLEVVQRAISHWQAHQDHIGLAQIEGFVRQIVGWREYMRGVYWAHMPEYATLNFFGHDRPLPGWFWTGETKMNCLSQAIGDSLDHAYAHHIQRLMVTGNFALLAGISPDELDRWYLGIYLDAIEWVEITNTRGMSQYADGGLVGSKPYVSSANYMDKMSDYCGSCAYDQKKRHGKQACPFNSLYWDFYQRHESLLIKHPRIGFAYKTLERMSESELTATLKQAAEYLENIDVL